MKPHLVARFEQARRLGKSSPAKPTPTRVSKTAKRAVAAGKKK